MDHSQARGISPEQFETLLSYRPRVWQKTVAEGEIICPSVQHLRHYAPRAHLYLGEESALSAASHLLGFSERQYPKREALTCLVPFLTLKKLLKISMSFA